MTKTILHKREDGGVCVTVYNEDDIEIHAQEIMNNWNSDLELVEQYGQITEYRITTIDKVPTDRTFRNAWTDENDTSTVDVNMDKAREIHMDNIRAVRDEKLKELDIEALHGADVQEEKQALRDIPATLDLTTAETPEELKAIWPELLT